MRTLLLILVAVFAGALAARNVDVQVVAAGESTAAKLRAQVEPAFLHVEKKTGLVDDYDLTLVVVGGPRSFADLARRDGVTMNAESVLGYAQPGQRRIVLNLSGIRERQLDPIGVLRHEIAHLVLGSALRVQRPLWFEEGVAQYVESVAINELIEAASANPLVNFADLDDLSRGLREEARSGPAYSETRETIRLMVDRYGQHDFSRFMGALERGDGPFEKAFEDTFDESVESFEKAWLKDREARAGSRWAGFLGGAFWWLLLGITGAMLPLFWLLRRGRGKSQIEKWEEQEEYYPSDPSWAYHDDDDDAWRPDD